MHRQDFEARGVIVIASRCRGQGTMTLPSHRRICALDTGVVYSGAYGGELPLAYCRRLVSKVAAEKMRGAHLEAWDGSKAILPAGILEV